MKAQILKHTGLTEKQFYAKYKTKKAFDDSKEGKAFKKAHGKEFKKAQVGMTLDKNNNGVLDYLEPINMNAIGQTQNWSDTQGYGNQQMNLGNQQTAFPKPQVPQEPDFEPIDHINNPGFGKKQQRASNAYHNQLPFDITGDTSNEKKGDGAMKGMGAMNTINKMTAAAGALSAEKELMNKTKAWSGTADVFKRAMISNAFAEKPKNQWFSPDDPRFIQNASELYNTQGGPTDVITQNGGRLQGGGEIQNTYAPNTLYDDLGYEPVIDKNYQGGGMMPYGGGGGEGMSYTSNAGAQMGEAMFGNIPGLGEAASLIGGALDPYPKKTRGYQNNINSVNAFASRINTAGDITGGLSNMGVGQNGQALQPYEEGGWVSNDWQPQVIASFGGLDEQEVYDYAHEGMDTLRAGGHMRDYTPVSDRGMETYAMGGQLQTHGIGEAETIGYNPYMPGSGEMSMLRGPSHKDGGIDISYGNAQNGSVAPQVNAEGGEPIIEMQGGGQIDPRTGQPSVEAVVLGNIPASLKLAKATGDKDLINLFTKYDGKTIKSIGNSLAKDNQKTEKYKDVVSKLVNDSDETADGLLKKKTGEIIELAIQTRYKQNAKEQMKLANWQSAVNDTKQDISYMKGKNISAEDLGKGKIKPDYDPITKDAELESPYAKNGAYLRKAQGGETTDPDDYETNIIKNLHDVIGITPDMPGYGTAWGPKSNKALFDYDSAHGDKDIMEAKKRGQTAYEVDKNFITSAKWGPNNQKRYGITEKGYKYIGKDKQAAANTPPTSTSTSTAVEEPSITEEQYNNFLKLYEEGKNTKSKKSAAIKDFQHLYHQSFPKEALAAIQKTTRENGLSNKAKAMGLTVQDITSGKDINKILESNEDEYFGPRTEQYMAKIASRFKKTPELALTPLGTKTTPTTTVATDKKDIGVIPLKQNKFGQYADMLRQFMPQDKLPGIDPRQFAGEYMAMAQNQYQPVQSQRMRTQLDPMTRISYQDIRNQNTADFRDAERNMAYNPAAISGLLGKKYLANQQGYGEEFRTNQGLEQQIYGGNRAKVNQDMATNLQLDAAQMDKQNIALSKTKEINQKAIASIADKYLQHDARNLEYNVKSNMFPTFAYDQSGRIRTQGPGYQPVIPQIYGGKSNIKQVPVYDTDGKTILKYQMQEYDPNAEQAVTQNGGSTNKKNKGSVVKNAKNGSLVKLQKNF